jgi:hypothetical protein
VLSIPETLKTETIVNGTTLIVRPVGGSPIDCWHTFGQNKLLTVTPKAILAADTTYEVLLTSGIQDAVGNGMDPYSFRFSTGSSTAGGNRAPTVSSIGANPAPSTPGASVSLLANASDPDGDALNYRFDFGDGSSKTAWSTNPATSHVYASARHYTVTVQAKDPSGAIGTGVRSVTVATAPTGGRPTNSSTIVVDDALRRTFVVHPDNSTVSCIDSDSLSVVWEAPTGTDPRSIARAADGTLWVTCHDADKIEILSATDGSLVATIALEWGNQPIAICPSPDRTRMYVSCNGKQTLRRFSVASRSEDASVALPGSPRAIAITADGSRALVTRFISAEFIASVYDIALGGSMALTRTIPLNPHWLDDGSASGRGVMNYLAGITIEPGSNRAWVVGTKTNTERGARAGPAGGHRSDHQCRRPHPADGHRQQRIPHRDLFQSPGGLRVHRLAGQQSDRRGGCAELPRQHRRQGLDDPPQHRLCTPGTGPGYRYQSPVQHGFPRSLRDCPRHRQPADRRAIESAGYHHHHVDAGSVVSRRAARQADLLSRLGSTDERRGIHLLRIVPCGWRPRWSHLGFHPAR